MKMELMNKITGKQLIRLICFSILCNIFITSKVYYQYKTVKKVIPEITFLEWFLGFAK